MSNKITAKEASYQSDQNKSTRCKKEVAELLRQCYKRIHTSIKVGYKYAHVSVDCEYCSESVRQTLYELKTQGYRTTSNYKAFGPATGCCGIDISW